MQLCRACSAKHSETNVPLRELLLEVPRGGPVLQLENHRITVLVPWSLVHVGETVEEVFEGDTVDLES